MSVIRSKIIQDFHWILALPEQVLCSHNIIIQECVAVLGGCAASGSQLMLQLLQLHVKGVLYNCWRKKGT